MPPYRIQPEEDRALIQALNNRHERTLHARFQAHWKEQHQTEKPISKIEAHEFLVDFMLKHAIMADWLLNERLTTEFFAAIPQRETMPLMASIKILLTVIKGMNIFLKMGEGECTYHAAE